jgi:hypothetical protein
VSNDEPEYLKALKRSQERRKGGEPPKTPATASPAIPTPAEREALRWAQEVGGKGFRVAPSLYGAKCALLVQPITPFGKPPITLEGVASRGALADRVRDAAGAGESVLGCYELTTGRPLSVTVEGGKVSFTPGPPRSIPRAESPERMIRIAAAQAELRAKSRGADGGGRGQGGQGSRGGRGR